MDSFFAWFVVASDGKVKKPTCNIFHLTELRKLVIPVPGRFHPGVIPGVKHSLDQDQVRLIEIS